MAQRVRITDVSPRDGLQNEAGVIPTDGKVRLVRELLRSGVDEIEVSSFVSPKWVPQLGDAGEVFAAIAGEKPRGMCFSALVPNERGLASAIEVNRSARASVIDKVSVFTAASETFSRRNTNATIAETFERFGGVVDGARREGLAIRGYISCVIACPFEGAIAPERVADVAERFAKMGVDEIDLGDTIGAGTRETTRAMLEAVVSRVGAAWLAPRRAGQPGIVLHLHDTFGRAGECVREALAVGVRSFDGAVAGLGGCPYASTPGRRAPGNIGTELLVRTIREAGFETGVRDADLVRAGEVARDLVARARDEGGRA